MRKKRDKHHVGRRSDLLQGCRCAQIVLSRHESEVRELIGGRNERESEKEGQRSQGVRSGGGLGRSVVGKLKVVT